MSLRGAGNDIQTFHCGRSRDHAGHGCVAEGLVGIAMPTKSSARWISDGNAMVSQFEPAGYKTILQYAQDDIPNRLAQIENMITNRGGCAGDCGD